MMMMTMMQRGTSGFVLFFCFFVFVFFSSRASTTTAACESDPQTQCGHPLQLTGEHRPRLLSHSGVNETHCCWWEIQSSPVRSLKTHFWIRKPQNPIRNIMGTLRYFFSLSLSIYIIKEDVTFTLLFCLIIQRLKSINPFLKKQTSVSEACLEIYI